METGAANGERVNGERTGEVDLAVVGGGILGLAVARELKQRHPGLDTVVLEGADRVGTGQTGHNSGVIHAGIYYAPGSLKARMCVAGARLIYELCERRGIAYDRCGKLIVARNDGELDRLDELERRGRENAVPGLRRMNAEELKEVEPSCVGVSAIHSPETGIVGFADVARALAEDLAEQDVPVATGAAVRSIDRRTAGSRSGTPAARCERASRCSPRAPRPTASRCSPVRRPTRASCPSAAAT